MPPPRTHFEQIPLEIVKRIAQEGIAPEKTTEQSQGIKKSNSRRDRPRLARRRSMGRES
jgi:hypothetical protein